MTLCLDAGIRRKVRCGIFKKIANRAIVACAGKAFWGMFSEKFFGEIHSLGKSMHTVQISSNKQNQNPTFNPVEFDGLEKTNRK